MNGIFANLPAAMRREGRSGTSPPGPSMTGTKVKASSSPVAVTFHALRSTSVLTFWFRVHGIEVLEFRESSQPGTFEMNVFHAGARTDALKNGRVPYEPDSKICVCGGRTLDRVSPQR